MRLTPGITPKEFLKGGPLRPFVDAMAAVELMYYSEKSSAGETPFVTDRMLKCIESAGLATAANADATLRRLGKEVAARFEVDNLHLRSGVVAGSGTGDLDHVTKAVQLGMSTVAASQQAIAVQLAAITAQLGQTKDELRSVQGQVLNLQQQLHRRSTPHVVAPPSPSAAAAPAPSAHAPFTAVSSVGVPDTLQPASSSASGAAAAAAAAPIDADSVLSSAAAVSSVEEKPSWTLVSSSTEAGHVKSTKGVTALSFYVSRCACDGRYSPLIAKDASRAARTIAAFDIVASPKQRAVLSATGPAYDEGKAILAAREIRDLLVARLRARFVKISGEVPSVLRDDVALGCNALDDRLKGLKDAGDAGAPFQFTAVRVEGDEHRCCRPLRVHRLPPQRRGRHRLLLRRGLWWGPRRLLACQQRQA